MTMRVAMPRSAARAANARAWVVQSPARASRASSSVAGQAGEVGADLIGDRGGERADHRGAVGGVPRAGRQLAGLGRIEHDPPGVAVGGDPLAGQAGRRRARDPAQRQDDPTRRHRAADRQGDAVDDLGRVEPGGELGRPGAPRDHAVGLDDAQRIAGAVGRDLGAQGAGAGLDLGAQPARAGRRDPAIAEHEAAPGQEDRPAEAAVAPDPERDQLLGHRRRRRGPRGLAGDLDLPQPGAGPDRPAGPDRAVGVLAPGHRRRHQVVVGADLDRGVGLDQAAAAPDPDALAPRQDDPAGGPGLALAGVADPGAAPGQDVVALDRDPERRGRARLRGRARWRGTRGAHRDQDRPGDRAHPAIVHRAHGRLHSSAMPVRPWVLVGCGYTGTRVAEQLSAAPDVASEIVVVRRGRAAAESLAARLPRATARVADLAVPDDPGRPGPRRRRRRPPGAAGPARRRRRRARSPRPRPAPTA